MFSCVSVAIPVDFSVCSSVIFYSLPGLFVQSIVSTSVHLWFVFLLKCLTLAFFLAFPIFSVVLGLTIGLFYLFVCFITVASWVWFIFCLRHVLVGSFSVMLKSSPVLLSFFEYSLLSFIFSKYWTHICSFIYSFLS